MNLHFTKMHGLGNDFIVIDAVNQTVDLTTHTIIELAKRNTGIGFDQCLIVEPGNGKDYDFFYRIFNADGQEVGQCGNGARCLARFVYYYGLTDKTIITVATKTTRMHLQLNKDKTVTVDFGHPNLHPATIPLQIPIQEVLYYLPLENHSCSIHAISVGNPHAVMVVNSLSTANVATLGKEISEHPLFPEQTNVEFMEIINSSTINLRVYERGCGETQACGSGAVAAAAIGRLYHQLDSQIRVNLPGGQLMVEWPDVNGSIFLTGPANFVYKGELCVS